MSDKLVQVEYQTRLAKQCKGRCHHSDTMWSVRDSKISVRPFCFEYLTKTSLSLHNAPRTRVCSHLEHKASVKPFFFFFHFRFLILRQLVELLGRGISPSQGLYLHKCRHIHALSGIKTHDLHVQVSADSSCLRTAQPL
jgi:hypothetical protein